jgi:hypothetical protein
MRFFRRGGDAARPDEVAARPEVPATPAEPGTASPGHVPDGPGPDRARAALFALGLPTDVRPSQICGPRGAAWAVTVPGERAIEAWRALRDRREPGWWPIVIGGADDEAQLVDAATENDASVEEILRVAAGLDPDEDGPEVDEDGIGKWPRHRIEPVTYTLPLDIRTGRPRPTVVALVPARESAEVPALLGWGDWNDCPGPEVHVAMHRRWAERYGAELVGISFDVIEMHVPRPPTTRDAAMSLAHEQCAYCPDIVDQGVATISNLGATLLSSDTWYFWWD